jgi:hypothetical protein
LQRILQIKECVSEFLEEKFELPDSRLLLQYKQWLSDLASLVDILIQMHFILNYKGVRFIYQLICATSAFKTKLKLLCISLREGNLDNFGQLK